MKRYSPVIEWRPDEPAEPGMSEHPNGLYVLASEAQEEIAEARGSADASRLERNDAEWDTVRSRALVREAYMEGLVADGTDQIQSEADTWAWWRASRAFKELNR